MSCKRLSSCRTPCLLIVAWMMACMMFVYHHVHHAHPVRHSPHRDFHHESWCKVDCPVGKPCEYLDEVDFRIIVMTFNRPDSLKKCVQAISRVNTTGKRVAVEIWIDKSKDKQSVDQMTLRNAEEFKAAWKGGRVCIHEREANAYIDGQWIDTWRPRAGTKEIGLMLEDDVDISPQTLRWLQAVHAQYDHVTDIDGYTLQMEGTRFFKGKQRPLKGPVSDNVFLYGVIGTWGYSPHPQRWRGFQDWFHRKDPSIKPYVPDILPTKWYRKFEQKGSERSMWEMWHIYYSHTNNLYTVYCNLHVKLNRQDVLLSFNRKEKGLHFSGGSSKTTNDRLMLTEWKPEYAEFPEKVVRYTYEGNIVT